MENFSWQLENPGYEATEKFQWQYSAMENFLRSESCQGKFSTAGSLIKLTKVTYFPKNMLRRQGAKQIRAFQSEV